MHVLPIFRHREHGLSGSIYASHFAYTYHLSPWSCHDCQRQTHLLLSTFCAGSLDNFRFAPSQWLGTSICCDLKYHEVLRRCLHVAHFDRLVVQAVSSRQSSKLCLYQQRDEKHSITAAKGHERCSEARWRRRRSGGSNAQIMPMLMHRPQFLRGPAGQFSLAQPCVPCQTPPIYSRANIRLALTQDWVFTAVHSLYLPKYYTIIQSLHSVCHKSCHSRPGRVPAYLPLAVQHSVE